MKKTSIITITILFIAVSLTSAQTSETDFIDFQIEKYSKLEQENSFDLRDFKTKTFVYGSQAGNMAYITFGSFAEWGNGDIKEFMDFVAYFADDKLIKIESYESELNTFDVYIKDGKVIYITKERDVQEEVEGLIPVMQGLYDYYLTNKYKSQAFQK